MPRSFDSSVLGRTSEDLQEMGQEEREEALGFDLSRAFDLLEAIEGAYDLPQGTFAEVLDILRPMVRNPQSLSAKR